MYMTTFAYRDAKWKWTIWKIVQTSFESAPQLLLQLHIIVQSHKNPPSLSGKSSLNLFPFHHSFWCGTPHYNNCIQFSVSHTNHRQHDEITTCKNTLQEHQRIRTNVIY